LGGFGGGFAQAEAVAAVVEQVEFTGDVVFFHGVVKGDAVVAFDRIVFGVNNEGGRRLRGDVGFIGI
jgi:hypothetical protein